ncbi:unnamed protein product [Blepharisma stoltei]|uniref:Uncharacterized protein n=1 Tax=Blepharisma stoltei TaxID=1481888 RepID=A0AAU9IY37_9CILI|nr:unnamed protein product [Blepharisma stoltei]
MDKDVDSFIDFGELHINDLQTPEKIIKDSLYQQCKSEIGELELKIKKTQKENQEISDTIEGYSGKLDNENLMERIERLEKENLELKIRNQFLEGFQKQGTNNIEISMLEDEGKELEQALQACQNECMDLKQQISQVGQMSEKSAQRLEEIKEACENYAILQKELKLQIEEFEGRGNQEDINEEILYLEEEIDQLKNLLIQDRAKRVQLEIAYKDKSKFSKNPSKINSLKISKILSEKNQEISQIDKEISTLKSGYDQYKREINKINKLLEDTHRFRPDDTLSSRRSLSSSIM